MNSSTPRTRRLLARLLTTALLCLAACATARAQTPTPTPQPADDDEPDFIVPARPTASNPAEFQRPGVLQLEYGFNGNWRAPGGASEVDTPLALRFAVSRRLLLEFDGDTPLSQSSDGTRTTGEGDTQLGVQAVLQHETKARPGVALAYYVKLPTASAAKGLGTGRVDHFLIALVSKNISKTTVDFNAIYLLAGRTTDDGHASSAQAAVAASRNVTKRFGVQGELSGFTRNDAQPGAMFTLGVVTYQVNRRLVFDAGVRAGLTPEAPRVGAVAGLTVGVADLYKHRRKP
jgi:Putative MetA-pathway of phenol degradation